jgi:phosphohistidine phosphatase
MQVYLLRHGIAEEGHVGMRDADRELTAEGKRKLRETLRVLANADVAPSLILSSPLVRAVQTAELARGLLKTKKEVLLTKALSPNSTVEQVWEELRVYRDEPELMLVGHEPLFSRLSAHLLGAADLRLDFKKGAILRVDIDSFGHQPRGTLRWFFVSRLASNTVRAGDKGD